MNRSRRYMEGIMDANNRLTMSILANGPHRNNRVDGAVRSIPPPAIMPVPSYELVTPEMAAAWLGRNTNNRHKRIARIERLARKLLAGRWTVTHQGVAIGADGTLYDGQHRLEAIVRSGVAVWMLVVRNLSPEARGDIDTGEKRLTNDNLAIVDGTPISNADAAIANTLRFMLFSDGTGCRPCEVDEMRDILARFSPGVAAIKRAMPTNAKSISIAPVVAAFVFAHVVAPDAIEKMAAQLHSGAGLQSGDPILALRNALTGADRALTRTDHFKRTLLVIDARLSGRTIKRAVASTVSLPEMPCFARFAKANGINARKDKAA